MTSDPRRQTTRPILAAAATVQDIEKSLHYYTPASVHLGPRFGLQDELAFRKVGRTVSATHYTFRNVVLDADTMMLVQDGLAIPETEYGLDPVQSNRPRVDVAKLTELDDDEDFIIGANLRHHFYFHWLTQCVPSIDWPLRQPRRRPVRLVLPRLEQWQEDILGILGYDSLPRLVPERGKQYLLPRAEYVTLLNGSTDFGACPVKREVACRVIDRLQPGEPAQRVVYLPGSWATDEQIVNAFEIEAMLLQRRFHIADRDRLSFAQRVNLLQQADVVIGVHDWHLTDVLFCKPGALLWEFLPPNMKMPTNNLLAQTAGVDYWGDLLVPAQPGTNKCRFDIAAFRRRLEEVHIRLACLAAPLGSDKAAQPQRAGDSTARMHLQDLMLAFEPLGCNCQFGFIQREAGAEPLSLLRFSSINVPHHEQLHKLVEAIDQRFAGLGDPGTVTAREEGAESARAYYFYDSVYQFRFHGGAGSDDKPERAQMVQREVQRLIFLRRKLLEDLEAGTKILVWHSDITKTAEEVWPLMRALRRLGPNRLLWVVQTDDHHRAGTVEAIEREFVKGYIEAPPSDARVSAVSNWSWFAVCEAAYNFFNQQQASS
jgi:capsular polysaccharide biosynthesis protein